MEFYSRILQPAVTPQSGLAVLMASSQGASPLLALTEDRQAAARLPRASGLYHFALRYSTREDLAVAYMRLTDAGCAFFGAAHHGVSEALYLSDPDGNGVELYADLPRSEWPMQRGQPVISSAPLSLERWLGSMNLKGNFAQGPELGHIHLQVSDLEAAERFYGEFLGLSVTQRAPGAIFFAAGNYHHHLAVNVWSGRNPPQPGSVGLVSYRLEVPITEILYCLRHRAPLLGYRIAENTSEDPLPLIRLQDPNGTWVEVQPSAGSLSDATEAGLVRGLECLR